MRSYSHSALKQFSTCPRQFHEVRILKAWPREETEQTRYGTELHLAMELAVRDSQKLPPQFAFMQPVLESLLGRPGELYPELELAVTSELEPCAFDSPYAWVRGIVDLAGIENDSAWLVDYKTGGAKYPDKDQLTLMSLLLFAHYPEVRVIKSALLFVLKNVMVKHSVKKEEAGRLWSMYRENISRIEQCHDVGVWNPKQSGLCSRYCSVLSCPFNGRN